MTAGAQEDGKGWGGGSSSSAALQLCVCAVCGGRVVGSQVGFVRVRWTRA